MAIFPYTLTYEKADSASFYRSLESVGRSVLQEGMQETGIILKKYTDWKKSKYSVSGELSMTLLEILSFGVLWNEHADKALHSNPLTIYLLRKTALARMQFKRFKPAMNLIKGRLLPHIVNGSRGMVRIPTKRGIHRLASWLEATGEYPLTAIHVRQWATYCSSLQESTFYETNRKILDYCNAFILKAEKELGAVLQNWDAYQHFNKKHQVHREDSFFTSRGKAEYYLNLVGGWIMNRSLSESFQETQHKLVVLPGCMRKSTACKAVLTAHGLQCMGCSETCQVNQIRKRYHSGDIKVAIIPHNSDYMRLISSLPETSTGIIGVACALNLLEGGYALLHKGFAAQCVYLDFSGCKKHWTQEGIPTRLNVDQLDKILTGARNQEKNNARLLSKTVA